MNQRGFLLLIPLIVLLGAAIGYYGTEESSTTNSAYTITYVVDEGCGTNSPDNPTTSFPKEVP